MMSMVLLSLTTTSEPGVLTTSGDRSLSPTELTADTSAENPFADEADARCFADGIVGAIGVDRINELDTGEGLQAGFEEMTSTEQESVVDTAFDCIDFGALIEDQMAASGMLSDDQMACVSDGLTEDVLRGLFMAEIRGEDPEQNEALLGVIMDCMLGG